MAVFEPPADAIGGVSLI